MKTKLLIWTALVALATGTAMAATNEVSTLLQKGLFEEEANHNLDAAIQAYQSVITQTEKDRQFAATAIFRLGECYRKQGKTNEANAQYQRILREFPDQTELAKLSEGYVGSAPEPTRVPGDGSGGGGGRGSGRGGGGFGVRDLEAEEIKRIQELIKDSPDLINQKLQPSGETRLHQAVEGNQLAVARFLLDNKADPNVKSQDYAGSQMAPLHSAVKDGNQKMVELLVSNGADINATAVDGRISQGVGFQPFQGFTALHFAAAAGNVAMVEVLLNHGAKVDAKDGVGKTPLHVSAQKGFKTVAETLLAHGADVNARDKSGATPLFDATSAGNKAVVELLLANKADVNSQTTDGRTPLMTAASRSDIAEMLLEHGADVNAHGSSTQTALFNASAWQGSAEVVKLLLEHGADPNATVFRPNSGGKSGYTSLMIAAGLRKKDVVEMLLAHKANVNASDEEGVTALLEAVKQKDVDIATLLLEHHADPNLRSKDGLFALWFAAAGANEMPAMAKLLLEHGADVNYKTPSSYLPPNWSTLDFAIRDNKLEMAKLLLEKGADPNAPVNEVYNGPNSYYSWPGTTPLMMAVNKNQNEMAALLLEHKAEINAQRPDGSTALTDAITRSQKDMVALLLEHHADPNIRNKEGQFALSMLMGNGGRTDKLEVAKLLLEHGADANERDNNGQSALHLAASNDAKDMVELLLAHGADVNLKDKQGKAPLDLAPGPNNPRAGGAMPGFPMPPPMSYQWQPNQPGTFVGSPGMPGGPSNPGPQKNPDDVAALLREHGAVSEIEVSSMRTAYGSGAPHVVFQKDADSFNHFSLLEAIASPGGRGSFPDFSKITIVHRGKKEPTKIDLLNGTNGFDCDKDVLLEFGDVVEIPEREHALSEQGGWLTSNQGQSLEQCLARKITVTVKGETKELTRNFGLYLHDLMNQTDMLKVLRSTSDLTRVKVKRIDPVTKKPREIVVNTRERYTPNDVWMRDGDVVEVPERSEAKF